MAKPRSELGCNSCLVPLVGAALIFGSITTSFNQWRLARFGKRITAVYDYETGTYKSKENTANFRYTINGKDYWWREFASDRRSVDIVYLPSDPTNHCLADAPVEWGMGIATLITGSVLLGVGLVKLRAKLDE